MRASFWNCWTHLMRWKQIAGERERYKLELAHKDAEIERLKNRLALFAGCDALDKTAIGEDATGFDLMGAIYAEMVTDRNRWLERAEALEAEMRKSCDVCTHNKDNFVNPKGCDTCCDTSNWQFDEERLAEEANA